MSVTLESSTRYFKDIPFTPAYKKLSIKCSISEKVEKRERESERISEKSEEGAKDVRFYRGPNHKKVRAECMLDIPRASAHVLGKSFFKAGK